MLDRYAKTIGLQIAAHQLRQAHVVLDQKDQRQNRRIHGARRTVDARCMGQLKMFQGCRRLRRSCSASLMTVIASETSTFCSCGSRSSTTRSSLNTSFTLYSPCE